MGSNLLHDLLARVPFPRNREEHSNIGPLRPRNLVTRYGVSRSQVVRLLSRAQEVDNLGWSKPPYDGDVWISKRLVDDYMAWQAVKLATISQAFAEAQALL
ncbi:hypothetical protein QO002_000659 [Pararhizobium capsulatum DSM 1112]|uniref:Pyocin activator protein PrtN n=1 Tax=Pararhizobium capsulatum DSM 1112 TaxID=1121113 RepID=A0ABU0BJU5_9HYPH|nr:hypothetical protein [Pararhizobium capsulatum]MDQ0318521.1 hypothetical protein [Pararhizobium capsulatum DSM 1112]